MQLRPAPEIDGRAPVTCNKYDALGRMTELWAGSTLNPSAPCDLSGADPDLKKQAAVVTNDFGWKVKETDPLGHVWTWSYDRFGNVTEATDAKNQKTQMVWGYGHQLQSRTVRDANGNVYRTETFTRNALGQPTRVEARDAAGNLIAGQETAFDAAHRVTRLTDLRPGTSARARSFAWSPGGMLNTMQDQNGARTDYLYDPVGNLIGIWGPNFDYLAFTHDAGGRLTEKWDPNGINSQYEWNPDNTLARLANRVAFDDSHTISVHEYDYDALGRRQTATDKAGTLTLPAQNDTYAYDALDNRTRKTVNGVDQYAIFDAANQLVELRSGSPTGALAFAFVYDANGNLTMKCEGTGVSRTTTTCSGSIVSYFTWNPDDQLIGFNKLSLSETYQYDHLGRRISKMSNGVTTYYRVNGDDIDAEYSATWSETARYVHGPNTDDPLMRLTGNTSDPSATAIYYHQDGINSVVATSDQAGNIVAAQLFDAWGNRVQSTGSIAQYGYTGREPDATGMIYYRARYYDPALGRFISRDPAGMPNGVNRYAYVNNNPINFTDPSGLEVYIGGHIAASPAGYTQNPDAYHLNIVMIPNNPGAFTNPQGWSNLGNGYKIATLGGQPGGQASWTDPLGNLKSSPNNSGDSIFNATFLQRVDTPKGMTDTQFINRLIKSANSYQNKLNYDLKPQAGTDGYNSNSYVAGVIKAAGGVPPTLNTNGEFQAPGYDKPIPLGFGGASGSWGGGASGSWGSGTQNLQSFSKPPPTALNPMPSARSSK